jgi:serine/threonine-protein kinase
VHPVGIAESQSCNYVLKIAVSSAERERAEVARGCLARETRVAREVSHPHLLTVFDGECSAEAAWLVQPYYGADTLRNLVQDSAPLPQLLWSVRQTCSALASLHAAGWLHGDLAPENVVVDDNGHATLIDLGFARKLHSLECDVAQTPFQGRVHYAAPEAFSASGALTAAVDMYALGVMLFELLAGCTPFDHYALEEIVAVKKLTSAPDLRELLPEIPYALSQLVARLLSREPLRRPTPAQVMEQCLALEVATFRDWL